MLKNIIKIGLLLLLATAIHAQCDFTHFRWDCEEAVPTKPKQYMRSLVYCGNSYVYVSKNEYDIIARAQRDNIQMVLKANGEYIDSPCLAAERL